MVARILAGTTGAELSVAAVSPVLTPEGFTRIQDLVSALRVDPVIVDYAVRLVTATRKTPALETGAGPRGSLALIRCARARALLEGRDFVLPDDIKALILPVLAHRLTLSAESELEGASPRMILEHIAAAVEAPRP